MTNVNSADKKPEKYVKPSGKVGIRMVPVDTEVVKNEDASKEAQHHAQGMKDARADMKAAKSNDAMTKAMNKLQHHTKAHKKATAAMKEAYDEPQGQAKRMMSPLQKARMDKEKADRDRDGKLKPGAVKRGKSTMNRLKDIRQRADAFAAKSRKEEVEQVDEISKDLAGRYAQKAKADATKAGHEVEKEIQSRGYGSAAKPMARQMKRLKGIDQAKKRMEAVEQVDEGNMMSAAKELETYARKFGGIDKGDFIKASVMMKKNQKKQLDKFVDELDTEPREKIQSVMRKHIKENISEVLDRPGALDSYRKKADASGNKARNSATRKILTAPKDGKRPDHSDELKTMRKRNKGQDMADRVANKQFRKSIGLGYNSKKEEVEQVDEISNKKMGQYVRKATDDAARRAMDAGEKAGRGDSKGFGKQMVKSRQRVKGVQKAMDKMDKNRLFGRQ
jgi:hypothetical protein